MRHPEPFFHEHLTHLKRLYRPTRRYWKFPIDIFALADVLLLLVCFVLVGQSNFVRFGMPVHLPEATSLEAVPVDAKVLAVSRYGGRMYLDNRWVTQAGLDGALRQIAVDDPNRVLIIEADKSLRHGELVRLYNSAREAGLRQIRIAAQVPGRGLDELIDRRDTGRIIPETSEAAP